MAYERLEVIDNKTVIDKFHYDNLQDGIEEAKEEIKEVAELHKITTFTSLEQIGIKTGEETIAGIVLSLPKNSKLQMVITNNHNTSIYPCSSGTCIIEHNSPDLSVFRFYGMNNNQPKQWYGYCINRIWFGWSSTPTAITDPQNNEYNWHISEKGLSIKKISSDVNNTPSGEVIEGEIIEDEDEDIGSSE